MALPRTLIERLPNLKLITIIGKSLPNLDMAAASERGVLVAHSNFANPRFSSVRDATPELAWGLMIATVRNLAEEHRRMRDGGWQTTTGLTLSGKTLGLLGLGGSVDAWPNTGTCWHAGHCVEPESHRGGGDGGRARQVDKATLFEESDVVSIHLVLSERTRGLVAEPELALMKPHAYLINTSRGPIVDEAALIAALKNGSIAGAGLDVYDVEPPAPDHPLRTLPNVTLSPHLGYVTARCWLPSTQTP